MKTDLKKIVISIIITGLLLAYWKLIYIQYVDPEIGFILALDDIIPLGIYEEIVFRWLPYIVVSSIYVWSKKVSNPKLQGIILSVLILLIIFVQLISSIIHMPIDPIVRQYFYELPPRITSEELCKNFLSQGVLAIILSLTYYIWIDKKKPLKDLQLASLIACIITHIIYNVFILRYH